jgi:hypothetical protein
LSGWSLFGLFLLLLLVRFGHSLVVWFNNRRPLEPIGNIPPAEAETACYANMKEQTIAA